MQRIRRRQEALQAVEYRQRLAFAATEDRHDTGKHLHRIGIASEGRQLLFQIAVGRLGGIQVLNGREDHVGSTCRQRSTGGRAAGLDDDGMPLRAALHAKRSPHRKMAADVIERVNALGIHEQTGFGIGNQRTVFPSVPKPANDIDEFARDFVALGRLRMTGTGEVQC